MVLETKDLNKLERRYRANLINSITGIKPANLIGSRSKENQDNLAIFSSVVHLGSHPAQIGMVTRPQVPNMKDTYSNILETGFYTINHVLQDHIKKAHYTSGRFEKNVSEFERVNLESVIVNDFFAPFVSESPIKIGLKHIDSLHLPNGCIFIIGEVVLIELPEEIIDQEGHLDLAVTKAVGITGLNSYYALEKITTFPYAALNDIPDFSE